jgi:hypothetical protein
MFALAWKCCTAANYWQAKLAECIPSQRIGFVLTKNHWLGKDIDDLALYGY